MSLWFFSSTSPTSLHIIIFMDCELTKHLKMPHMNPMKWHSKIHTLASGCFYSWYSNSSSNICVYVTASIINHHYRYSQLLHPFSLRIKCNRNKLPKYFSGFYVNRSPFKDCKTTEKKSNFPVVCVLIPDNL